MKLAEALIVRADITKKINSLRERAGGNARVQDGERPKEDPNELLKVAFRLMQDLEELVVRINRTNLSAQTTSGPTLTEAMAARDRLKRQHDFLTQLIKSASEDQHYYSNREIRWVETVDVAALHKQADDIARKLREINTEIQQTNWNVDLQE